MLLLINPSQFTNDHVMWNEPVKNQIFNDSTFSRIVYSNSAITTNGIHLRMDLKGITTDKKFNKTTVHFNIYNNRDLIDFVKLMEQQLLSPFTNKVPNYALYNELICGRIVTHDSKDNIVLKISGVWETDVNCGVTYKFIFI
jgi:hypothetical protein